MGRIPRCTIVWGYVATRTPATGIEDGRVLGSDVWVTDLGGLFDMPFIRHADEVLYVCHLCWILSGTEDYRGSMRRYELVGRAKSYNRFYVVKNANG